MNVSLQIGYIVCRPDRKFVQLGRLVQREPGLKFIVYFSTCACVEYFARLLLALKKEKIGSLFDEVTIVALHGKMDTKKRQSALDAFAKILPGKSACLLCTDVAARGLDVPDVDRVIQYDPPQDPKTFAHRCGRTARAGRKGRAIVILNQGSEEVYPEYLSLKKIPMSRHPYIGSDGNFSANSEFVGDVDQDSDKLFDQIRGIVSKNREIYEKSVLAFVSWVRSYAKHELSYIFRIKELDLARCAISFGLLRV